LLYRLSFDADGRCIRIEKTETGMSHNGEDSNTPTRFIFYDSMNNITRITQGNNEYTAAYNAQGVRYITRKGMKTEDSKKTADSANAAVNFSESLEIQRNAQGLPIRVNRSDGSASEFAYDFDRRGNWTERRETVFEPMAGALVPTTLNTITRKITY
jgi:paraquat-inducible protein B